jgi:hypothetical protein
MVHVFFLGIISVGNIRKYLLLDISIGDFEMDVLLSHKSSRARKIIAECCLDQVH